MQMLHKEKEIRILHFAGVPRKRKIRAVQILSKLLTILVTLLFTDKILHAEVAIS